MDDWVSTLDPWLGWPLFVAGLVIYLSARAVRTSVVKSKSGGIAIGGDANGINNVGTIHGDAKVENHTTAENSNDPPPSSAVDRITKTTMVLSAITGCIGAAVELLKLLQT